jgi:hypothetical protein
MGGVSQSCRVEVMNEKTKCLRLCPSYVMAVFSSCYHVDSAVLY